MYLLPLCFNSKSGRVDCAQILLLDEVCNEVARSIFFTSRTGLAMILFEAIGYYLISLQQAKEFQEKLNPQLPLATNLDVILGQPTFHHEEEIEQPLKRVQFIRRN